jgi:membrane associated rhomboid family serine protease
MQYATSAFVHATTTHLLRNLPIMWLAGEIVRAQTGSALGAWITYIFCAVGMCEDTCEMSDVQCEQV